MTECVRGGHDFPIEDSRGATCPQHGITLLYRGDPIRPEDLTREYPVRPARLTLGPAHPSTPALAENPGRGYPA